MQYTPGKRGYLCTKCGKTRRAVNPDAMSPNFAEWPTCCGEAMKLMGHRQAQAASLLDAEERLEWVRRGALIMKGDGRRKWRPILSEKQIDRAYRLP
jgi:hypothetical protein